ncbi:MAG: metallophosphoesterase family protein [Nitrososphaerales archaeon]
MDLESLKFRALNADARDFSEQIARLIETLSRERLECKAYRVNKELITLQPEGKVIVVGDLHGDLISLLFILSKEEETLKNKDKWFMIFLGDYGDRGSYSAEVYYILATLKLAYPENIILIRGNHEGPEDLPFYPFDLPYQLSERFGSAGINLISLIRKLFEYFYLGLYIEDRYVLLHGGIPIKAQSLEDIALAKKNHPKLSFLEEILWNDPTENVEEALASPRGYGKIFGKKVTERFLSAVKAKILIRAHEPCNGYKINHEGKIITLFSCKGIYPNTYAGYLKFDLKETLKDKELSKYVRKF